jgi:hypothetical protein
MQASKRAMVMSVEGQRMIVMLADGSWRSIRRQPGVQVGDEVQLADSRRKLPWSAVAAAAVVLLLITTSVFFLPTRQVRAYVSLDGIPGVVLATNARGQVLRAQADTPEGEELLTGLRIAGQSLENTVQQLLSKARQHGLSHDDSEMVLVSVTSARGELSSQVLQRLQEQAKAGVQASAATGTSQPQVEQLVFPGALQSEARSLGLSPGQYALALKASEAGVELELESLDNKNVVQALKELGLNPGQLIKQLRQEGNLERLLEEHRDKVRGRDRDKEDESSAHQHAEDEGHQRAPGQNRIPPGQTKDPIPPGQAKKEPEAGGRGKGNGRGNAQPKAGDSDRPSTSRSDSHPSRGNGNRRDNNGKSDNNGHRNDNSNSSRKGTSGNR